MQSRNLSTQLQRLRELFNKANVACGSDIEMRSHWAKYLCVLCSGFLENAISEIYGDFVRGAASKPVANYADSILSKIQNPKASKFIETAQSFKKEWATSLESFLASNGGGAAINAIMTNRHKIAHGENSDVTLVQVKDYLDKAVEVIEFIETQCRS